MKIIEWWQRRELKSKEQEGVVKFTDATPKCEKGHSFKNEEILGVRL